MEMTDYKTSQYYHKVKMNNNVSQQNYFLIYCILCLFNRCKAGPRVCRMSCGVCCCFAVEYFLFVVCHVKRQKNKELASKVNVFVGLHDPQRTPGGDSMTFFFLKQH